MDDSVNRDFRPPAWLASAVGDVDLQRFAKAKRAVLRRARQLKGTALRQYRTSSKSQLLERGARLVHEGKSVPVAARQIQRSPSTLRRYLHKTGLARKSKRGRLTVPRYRATYWLRIFSEARFPLVHLDRANAKRAGEFMHAVREAMRFNDRAFIAGYTNNGVYDADGHFHVFETRMNILHRLHNEHAPAESLDLEYEVEVA